jgi:ABC-type amino acid transport system permease subunit
MEGMMARHVFVDNRPLILRLIKCVISIVRHGPMLVQMLGITACQSDDAPKRLRSTQRADFAGRRYN